MAIRLPLTTVLDTTLADRAVNSVIGGWAYNFKLPPDTDNVVVKFTPSIIAGGASATFQTSDDGGSTFFDVARTSTASANSLGAAPQFLSIPVISGGVNPQTVVSASVVGAAIGGSAGASTLSSGQVSGLPVLGIQNRVFVMTTGNATSVTARIQVMVNSQSRNA
jgi:hypothetical protein